jgi:hypothetical protein
MKELEKKEALRLRIEDKLSLKQIAEKTGLAKSTLSVLLKDYPLSEERVKELSIGSQLIGAQANRDKALARHADHKFEGVLLMGRYPSFRELCFLYWGEGTKFTGNNSFSICNSDRYMVKFILNVLKELNYNDKVKLTCYCYEHSDEQKIKEYWENFLDKEIFIYKAKKSKSSKELNIDKQPFGTMRVDVYSKRLLNNVIGGIEAIRGTLI